MKQDHQTMMNIILLTSLSLGISQTMAKPVSKMTSVERTRVNREAMQKVTGQKKDLRLSVDSGWFYVDEDAVDFQATYNGWDILKNKRIRTKGIFPKAFQMIDSAKKQIIASFFLFDNMYSNGTPESRIVEELTTKLIQKKKDNPDINITLILDPLHRGYARRVSPKVKQFKENGIDVYYSDLLYSKSANRDKFVEGLAHTNRILDHLTFGFYGASLNAINSAINVSKSELDGEKYDLHIAFGASLMKANHRKILVTDIDGSTKYETLVTSANPHNASDDSTNTSLTVKGDLAKYIYEILRQDVIHSLKLEGSRPLDFGANKYAYLSDETRKKFGLPSSSYRKLGKYFTENLPIVNIDELDKGQKEKQVRTKFVTEGKVKTEVLRLINEATSDDVIRIQMFYLSDLEIVEALKEKSHDPKRHNNPIQIILDPNKDAFNSIKDGTPNRQVAHYLHSLNNTGNIKIRWYATHGEQNHAKAMTVTNESTKKYQIMTGSTNWTGKNMNDINMEANISVEGSKRLNDKFNNLFDRLWNNQDPGILYTWNYSAYDIETTMKLVLGYQVIKKWSKKDYKYNVLGQAGEIISRFMQDFSLQNTISILSVNQFKDWANDKFEKDQSAVLREISLIVGEKEVEKLDEKEKEKWIKKYMKKWQRGEKKGYVAW